MSRQRHGQRQPAFEMIWIVAQAGAQQSRRLFKPAAPGKAIGQHQVIGFWPYGIEQLPARFDHVLARTLLFGLRLLGAAALIG